MAGDHHVLRRVEWGEIFPWLMILRVFRLATSAPLLLLASLGVLLSPLGSMFADSLLPSEQTETPTSVVQAADQLRDELSLLLPDPDAGWIPDSWSEFVGPMWRPIQQAVHPFQQLFRRDVTLADFARAAIGGCWLLLIWSVLGGAISRVAVMRLGREEREGMGAAVRFAGKRFLSYFGGPLFAMTGVAAIALVGSILGLILRIDAGVIVGAALWIFVLLGGLLATILLVGLLFGWPLMWAAISAEEMGDVFEAAQRGYSYTFGRPLHYLFYSAVALLIGAAGFVVVQNFAAAVIEMSYWSVSWGAGEARLNEIAHSGFGMAMVGNVLIQGFNSLVLLIASAYRYSFFWCAVSAIYLLLRRDIDRTDFDDVYAQDDEQRFGLPPLATDEAGVPGVAGDEKE
jgi:hypothetical protein